MIKKTCNIDRAVQLKIIFIVLEFALILGSKVVFMHLHLSSPLGDVKNRGQSPRFSVSPKGPVETIAYNVKLR